MESRRWNNTTKAIVVAALVALTLVLLITFRAMIAPTIVAFLLAFILGYPVNWIQQRTGWSRGGSVAALYVVLLAILALTPVVIAPRIGAQLISLLATLEGLLDQLQSASEVPFLSFANIGIPTEVLINGASDALQGFIVLATTSPISIARGVTTGILTVVYVLVLNFWLLKDLRKLQRFAFEQIPGDYQEDVRRLGQELGQVWNAFLRGQIVLSLVVGVITWIVLSIVGMPGAGGLALLAGLMEFLPTVGPAFSGTVGTAAALFQGSLWMPVNSITFAIIVGALYAIMGQLESVYLIPRLIGRRVKLHPAVTFVGIINGAIAFGVLGLLLATPVMGSARTILSYIYRKLFNLEPFEPRASQQEGMRIRGLIGGRKVEAVVFDLDGTLVRIDPVAINSFVSATTWLEHIVPAEQRAMLMRNFMVAMEGIINFLIAQLRRFGRDELLDRLSPTFNVLRGYAAADVLEPVAGTPELLRELSQRYRLALVSTRQRETVEHFLRHAGLQHAPAREPVARQRDVGPSVTLIDYGAHASDPLDEPLVPVSAQSQRGRALLAGKGSASSSVSPVAVPQSVPAQPELNLPSETPLDLIESTEVPLFESVITREDVRNLLPYSDLMLAVAEQLDLPLEQILVVSDTDANLRAGRASGMITVGVLSGLGREGDFADADLILPDTADLGEWL